VKEGLSLKQHLGNVWGGALDIFGGLAPNANGYSILKNVQPDS